MGDISAAISESNNNLCNVLEMDYPFVKLQTWSYDDDDDDHKVLILRADLIWSQIYTVEEKMLLLSNGALHDLHDKQINVIDVM